MARTAIQKFGTSLVLTLSVALGCAGRSFADDEPAANRPPEAVLHLTDGELLPGVFAPSDTPGAIVLRPDATGGLREFRLWDFRVVEFTAQPEKRVSAGDYEFVLDTGDALTGSLKSIKGDTAELALTHLGTISIPTQRLRRISLLKSAGRTNLVSTDRDRKTAGVSTGGAWRLDAGQWTTEQAGAFYQCDSALGDRAEIELGLSWAENPSFEIVLGHGADPDSIKTAYRIAVWRNDLVLFRELPSDGDVCRIQSLVNEPGSIRLTVYLDQVAQECRVFSAEGRQLAAMKMREDTGKRRPALRIVNQKGGKLRLETLRVRPWNGTPVSKPKSDEWRAERVDGSFVTGRDLGFDAATNHFRLQSEHGDAELPAGDLVDLLFRTDRKAERGSVSAVYFDGTRIGGDLLRVDNTALWLSAAGVKEVRVPFAGLRMLLVAQPKAK